jgi:transcriptional regulator with XRE-family HTH domain
MINLADTDWTHAFMRILGDEIRRLRKARGWIREDLRIRLSEDISLQTLATYELGTRKITVVRLLDICNALDTTPAAVIARAYERWQDDPDASVGRTIDLFAAARLDVAELTPLRNWAITRLAGLSDEPPTAAKTAWLTQPALNAMATLCGLDPTDMVKRLPCHDLDE